MSATIDRLISYALEYEKAANAFGDITFQAACAEAEHKAARAKEILAYKARGAKAGNRISHAEAETAAEADDVVADFYMARLTSAALADSARQKLGQLRAMVDVARTVATSDRAADMHHASGYSGAA